MRKRRPLCYPARPSLPGGPSRPPSIRWRPGSSPVGDRAVSELSPAGSSRPRWRRVQRAAGPEARKDRVFLTGRTKPQNKFLTLRQDVGPRAGLWTACSINIAFPVGSERKRLVGDKWTREWNRLRAKHPKSVIGGRPFCARDTVQCDP